VKPIFITGIGTDVGKTVIAAIVVEALKADYWKPVQAGLPGDTETVKGLVSNSLSVFHKERYVLQKPASPHLSAREEGAQVSIKEVIQALPNTSNRLVIEGAGGLMVPLNQEEFVVDLIKQLDAQVILVSSNYLGSINHSLLTAAQLRSANVPVLGWIFNGDYVTYEDEIATWTNYPKIGRIPQMKAVNRQTIAFEAEVLSQPLKDILDEK
jgi:dethiobiotin synthetase